jgi:hypothetical protein
MSDDITQKLRVTMPDFKGLEISCPCRIRSLLMKDAADEIEKLTRERDEARAEVERLREVLLHISRYETVGPAGFEWDIVVEELIEIARKALEVKP